MSVAYSKSAAKVKKAAQSNVAVFDLSDRTQIEITGTDRVRFLHGLTSNDIKKLKSGQGCETFVTNLKGKIVAHVFVFCSDQSLWLDGTPGQWEAIKKHLGQYILIDDVQLVSRNTDRGELFVTGPFAAQLLQLENELSVCGSVTRDSAGQPFDIRRVDLLNQPGFLLSIPLARIDSVKQSLTALGVVEGSREQFETLRIETGFPRFGIDLTDDNLAQEAARTKQCVSFDKGCYLGQETIARIDSLGHTNRELRRIRFLTTIVPDPGTPVFDDAGTTEVGVITSAANEIGESETDASSTVVALGQLKRDALAAGTAVRITVREVPVTGQVL